MCSLEEAFGPVAPTVPGMNGGMRSYNTHGFSPMGPGQQAWNPSSHAPDMIGQPMTQTDNRRQYAEPANGLEHKRWQDNWSKPDSRNFTRGVHSNRSRENRVGDPRQHSAHTGAGGSVKMQSSAYYPPRSLPGSDEPPYPHNADYIPTYINALDGSIAPGAPLSSVGDAPRAAAAKNRLKDTFDSMSYPRESTIGPVPNPSDYRNMHPTQWDSDVSGAPIQARQFSPATNSVNMNSNNNNSMNSSVNRNDGNVVDKMMDTGAPSSLTDVKRLQEQIRLLNAKLDKLERKVGKVESSRSHDIILIVVLAVFLLFIVDSVFGFNKLT